MYYFILFPALELKPAQFLNFENQPIWYYSSLGCVSRRYLNNISHFPGLYLFQNEVINLIS